MRLDLKAFHPGNTFRWDRTARRNAVSALILLAIMGAWWLGVNLRTRAARKNANELVEITTLLRDPLPNGAGNRFLFMRSTEQGLGLYLKSVESNKIETIEEIPETRVLGHFYLLQWCPDDSILAYTRPKDEGKQEIVLCEGTSGKRIVTIPVQEGTVDSMRWTTPKSFVYINGAQQVYLVKQGLKGGWTKKQVFKSKNSARIHDLAVLGERKLAWRQDGAIWILDDFKKLRQLWKPTGDVLRSSDYSDEKQKFLINLLKKDETSTFLTLGPNSGVTEIIGSAGGGDVSRLKWLAGGEGYAYHWRTHWGDSLVFTNLDRHIGNQLMEDGHVANFKSNLGKLYIYGSMDHEPRGFWEYDLATTQLECLIAPQSNSVPLHRNIKCSSGSITQGSRTIYYQIWQPRDDRPGKRYPLILSASRYIWNPYPLMAARSGFCFVWVSLRYEEDFSDALTMWETDLMAVYNELKGPNIDKSRTYLFGASAQTSLISTLMDEQPNLWTGALLLDPTGLPNVEQPGLKSIFIASGEERNKFQSYQTKAAKRGIPVDVFSHPDGMHVSYSKSNERGRLEAFGKFLSHQN